MRTVITLALLIFSTNIFAQENIKEETYKEIQRLTQEMIETMNHDEWTDHNIHDPGISMIEMVCYALIDLDVRDAYERSAKMCELLKEFGGELGVKRVIYHE